MYFRSPYTHLLSPPFTSLLPFFTILAFPSSYIQANDDAGH